MEPWGRGWAGPGPVFCLSSYNTTVRALGLRESEVPGHFYTTDTITDNPSPHVHTHLLNYVCITQLSQACGFLTPHPDLPGRLYSSHPPPPAEKLLQPCPHWKLASSTRQERPPVDNMGPDLLRPNQNWRRKERRGTAGQLVRVSWGQRLAVLQLESTFNSVMAGL